jgi:peroxiredoxin 2/4
MTTQTTTNPTATASSPTTTAATTPTTSSMPRINDAAPQFDADTTHGPIKLGDYKGKWVVLFSHPAAFTPVCTTEFAEFARRSAESSKRDVQLIGLSTDPLFSSIAWIRDIEKNFDVRIGFPVIADPTRKVSSLFGMIHPGASDTATVRTVFIIDPKQTIRALVYYPLNVGRNVDEIVRVVDALQTADKHGVACPANWKPGEAVIVPPPRTQKDAEARLADKSVQAKEWWFSTKKV